MENVQTYFAVTVHTWASVQQIVCWRCVLTARNAKEGRLGVVQQDIMQKACCENYCFVYSTSCFCVDMNTIYIIYIDIIV